MLEYKKHQLIVNGKVVKCFKFEIRNIIKHGDEFIVFWRFHLIMILKKITF